MTEYIKRDDVIETIRIEVQNQISRMGLHQIHIVDMLLVEDAVMKIPSADVTERKTGKWMAHLLCDGKLWANYCSECGTYLPYGLDWKPNFCPACGKRMVSADV